MDTNGRGSRANMHTSRADRRELVGVFGIADFSTRNPVESSLKATLSCLRSGPLLGLLFLRQALEQRLYRLDPLPEGLLGFENRHHATSRPVSRPRRVSHEVRRSCLDTIENREIIGFLLVLPLAGQQAYTSQSAAYLPAHDGSGSAGILNRKRRSGGPLAGRTALPAPRHVASQ